MGTPTKQEGAVERFTGHTPGPWEFDGEYVWADAIKGYVANPQTEDMLSGESVPLRKAHEQIKANGHLIAAAPSLLSEVAALRKALEDERQANHEIAIMMLDEDRAGCVKWARGIEISFEQGDFSVRVDLDVLQQNAYAEGRRDEQQELASVLPGTTYMDPPDGGAPTILEQLQRQAKDAARWCMLPAFLEKYQINYLALLRDIDAALKDTP